MGVLVHSRILRPPKWCIRVAIAFAIFTLLFETKNLAQVVYRKRSSYKNDFTEEELSTRSHQAEETRNVLDQCTCKNQSSEQEKEPQVITSSPTMPTSTSAPFIVILTQWRFGSSIVGELFNQNPDVFFLFEPLYLLDLLRKAGKLPESFVAQEVHDYSTSVLGDIAACNLTKEFVRVTNQWGGLINNRAVCEATNKRTGCKFKSAEMINNLCSKFKGVQATKVIRADLDNIKPLVIDGNVNVKVIHLVRDPRGAAASRIHYYNTFSKDVVKAHAAEFPKHGRLSPMGLMDASKRHKDCIPTMCKWMRETIQDTSSLPDWLKGRYHRVRYEDFATAPLNVTEELYRFVGLHLPDRVRTWLHQNTEAKHSGKGTFDVHKNSRETAKKWLSDLSDLEIQQVEDECLDVMNDLGYERYADLKGTT